MKNKRKNYGFFSLLLSVSIVLTACHTDKSDNADNGAITAVSSADTGGMDFEFDEKDLSGEYDEADIIEITGATTVTEAPQTTAAVASSESETTAETTTDVSVTESTSTAVSTTAAEPEIASLSGTTITSAGTYKLTGTITDKVITVEAGEKDDVTLVLDNVTLSNSTGPTIYIKSADKVYITLADGTTNTVSDGSAYTLTDGATTVDAAIFSKSDLTINGTGTLNVEGNCKHGIVSKDDLIITAGNLNVISENVGLNGKDCVKISSGTFNITSGSDGIRSDNEEDTSRGYVYIEGGNLNITSANDGIQAETVIKADNASVTIKSGGGSGKSLSSSEESYKGMKAGSDILLSGGTYSINSKDDCIHSNNTVSITGGTFTLSSGDDGIHADTDLSISGGNISITQSYEGLEGSRILISGGEISIVASDDGINAAGGNDSSSMGGRFGQGFFSSSTGEIIISGGYTVVNASGDGIDSNNSLEITGGVTLVSGPTNNGNGALDYGGTASITDGVLIALGSSGMAQSISSSETQGVLACSFNSQSGGQSFLVSDGDGNAIVSFTPSKTYECAVVSAPDIDSDGSYTIVVGATVSGADENGFAQNTSYSGGTELNYSTLSGGFMGEMHGGFGGGMGGMGDMPDHRGGGKMR